MTPKRIAILIALFTLVSGAVIAGDKMLASHSHDHDQVLDHGGGLDQCGGHMNRKTGMYHYHRTPRC